LRRQAYPFEVRIDVEQEVERELTALNTKMRVMIDMIGKLSCFFWLLMVLWTYGYNIDQSEDHEFEIRINIEWER